MDLGGLRRAGRQLDPSSTVIPGPDRGSSERTTGVRVTSGLAAPAFGSRVRGDDGWVGVRSERSRVHDRL